MENSELQERIDAEEEYGIITPEFDEYFGAVVISKPITIDGQGSTICSKTGPVVSITSESVIVKNLRIETSLSDDTALKVQPGIRVKMENVIVKGKVSGLIHEDGVWDYPDVLHIYPVIPREKNYFCFDLNVPVSCVMETDIANLRIVNPGLQPGHNRVCLEIEGLKQDIVLFGQIEIRSPYLTRLIAISGGSFGVDQKLPKPDARHPIILNKIEKTSESAPKNIAPISISSKPLMKWGIIGAGALILLIVAMMLIFSSSSDKSDKSQKPVAKEESKPSVKPSDSPAVKPPAPPEKTEADKQKEQRDQQIKALTESGNKALQSDNLQDAEKYFQQIVGLDKENTTAKTLLVQIGKRYADLGKKSLQEEDCRQAHAHFQSARRLAPDDPDIAKAEAAAKEAKGTLNIHCDPPADIVIDDSDIKKTAPANGIKLECGKHNIKLIRKNDAKYPLRTAEIAIRTNRTVKVIAIGSSVNVVNE